LLVGLHIVHVDDVDVVEGLVEGFGDLGFYVDNGVENTEFLQVDEFEEILCLAFEGILPLYLVDQHEVDVDTQKIFDFTFEWPHITFFELTKYKLLVRQEHFFLIL
jgi:hypothetical protein